MPLNDGVRRLVGRLASLARGEPAAGAEPDAEGLMLEASQAAAAGDRTRSAEVLAHLLARFPRHAGAHRLLGVVCAQSGDFKRAGAHAARAAALAPGWADAHLALGNIRRLTGDVPGAEESYRRVIALEPESAAAHYSLGILLRRAGRGDEARKMFGRAHELDPRGAATTWELVRALLEAGEPAAARAAAERTLASGAADDGATAHMSLGLVHLWQHEPRAALERFERAAALAPDDHESRLHAGIAAQELARLDDALDWYERALALKPDHAPARWRRALVRLLKGEFDRAWPDYEARLASDGHPRRRFPQPRWQGEPLAGRTLLVHAEQGLGDEIMFASCLPELIAEAAHCIIDCHPRLAPLFHRSFPAATVHGGQQTDDISWLAACPVPDFQVPAGSVPLYRRRRPGDFPPHKGYLRADPVRVRAWRSRLGGLAPGLKVGLSWRGGTQISRMRLRSLTLEQLLPVLRAPRVQFVDLQYTDTAGERATLAQAYGIGITHWPDALADYDETAALVCALDLTVSVCTAVVHLAGALGRPVWVMTPYSPEWRYGAAGETMPWYPSASLVRQVRYGEWEPVLGAIARRLNEAVRGGTPPPGTA